MIASILAAVAVALPPPPSDPPIETLPDWRRRPSAEEIKDAYPADALALGVEGEATISCDIDASGVLSGCSVVFETPSGWGFGDAALSLAPRFAMRPPTFDGSPKSGERVRVPVQFMSAADRMLPSFDDAVRCWVHYQDRGMSIPGGRSVHYHAALVEMAREREGIALGDAYDRMRAAREAAEQGRLSTAGCQN